MHGPWASLQCTKCIKFGVLFSCWSCGYSFQKSWGFIKKKVRRKKKDQSYHNRKETLMQQRLLLNMWWWCVRATEASWKLLAALTLPHSSCLSVCYQQRSCTLNILQLYSIMVVGGGTVYRDYKHTALYDQTLHSLVSQWQMQNFTSYINQTNSIPLDNCTRELHYCQWSCHTLQNANHSDHYKRGATVFEYDQLFSAGLLLSAVVTFYLPFTQFTRQTDSCSTAAPSVGERREFGAGWIGDLAIGAAVKLPSCRKWRITRCLVLWQIAPPLCHLLCALFTNTCSAYHLCRQHTQKPGQENDYTHLDTHILSTASLPGSVLLAWQ